MKYFLVCFFVLLLSLDIHSQQFFDFYPDTVVTQPVQQPKVKVSSITLEGNLHELVITVGFPDRPNSSVYPEITQATNYPKFGIFEDGTTLEEYLIEHGSIPMDQWYGPALNKYYNTLSGGVYTVDFDFVKKTNGNRFTTLNAWAYYVALNGNSDVSVVYNKKQDILNDVAEEIYNVYPNIFDDPDCIHFTFEGLTPDEFWHGHGGTAYTNFVLTTSNQTVLYSGPISIQHSASAIAHERLHIIGAISDSPSGFNGFPDRGFDVSAGNDHHNMFFSYDAMYHNAAFLNTYSLYGLAPLLTHDLIFLGWIKPEEILEVNADNYSQYNLLKLADVNYPLTPQQLADGYKRIIKVMVKENYSGDQDEYFLIENHQATEFDKAFANYDEGPPEGDYNKGILVWHIKEKVNMINTFADNYIDLEVAVPYDDYYGNPIVPPFPYPADYGRPHNVLGFDRWNDNWAEDYDYQDDNYMYPVGNNIYYYEYPPDGGRHIWETTVPPPYGWYPPNWNYFHRLESMSSDFFIDQEIRGHVSDRMSDATRPSTKTWGDRYVGSTPYPSEKTHISIKNIKRETGYMSLRVLYNYWEGEVTENSTMAGEVTIGDNLTVATGVTLTIEGGTKISFDDDYTSTPSRSQFKVYGTLLIDGGNCSIASNGFIKLEPGSRIEFTASSQLLVDGVLNAVGTPNNKIVFDRVTGPAEITWGVLDFKGTSASSSILDYVEVRHGAGVQCRNSANITIQNSVIDHCTHGTYVYGAAPTIFHNNILDPYGNGIFGETIGYAPLIKGNTIKKLTNNLYNYEGIYFTNNSAASHITGNDIQGFDYGFYFGGGGETYFWDDHYITSFPNNRFANNVTGFCAAWGSFIMAGYTGNPPCVLIIVFRTIARMMQKHIKMAG